MKKKDIFLVGGILILALLCWLVPKGLRLVDGNKETELKITVAGEVYGTYSLEKNQVIKIQDTNVCEIKDGKVKMTEASCPDHVCIRQGTIDAPERPWCACLIKWCWRLCPRTGKKTAWTQW